MTVHPMVTWSYAYQEARKGPWEQYARDTERFQKRVEEAELVIGPVLLSNHRQQIYEKYYAEVQ